MQSLRAALKHGDLGDCVGNSGRIFSSRKPDQRLNLVGVIMRKYLAKQCNRCASKKVS